MHAFVSSSKNRRVTELKLDLAQLKIDSTEVNVGKMAHILVKTSEIRSYHTMLKHVKNIYKKELQKPFLI